MASINDLATAATIASSAVALQSSPRQEPARPSSSSSPPHSPSHAPAARPVTASGPDTSRPATVVMANEDGDSITVATGVPPPPPVLAAPRIELQNPSQVPIPAPPPPPSAPSADAAGNGGSGGSAADDKAGSSASAGAGAGVGAGDSMDGIVEALEPPVRGAFVVFEGMDRAGKTTQAKLLQQRCIESGRDVRFLRFPGESGR